MPYILDINLLLRLMLLPSNRLKFLDEISTNYLHFALNMNIIFTVYPPSSRHSHSLWVYIFITLSLNYVIMSIDLSGTLFPKISHSALLFFSFKGTYFLIYEKIYDFTSSVPLNCCWSTRYLRSNEKTSSSFKKKLKINYFIPVILLCATETNILLH